MPIVIWPFLRFIKFAAKSYEWYFYVEVRLIEKLCDSKDWLPVGSKKTSFWDAYAYVTLVGGRGVGIKKFA